MVTYKKIDSLSIHLTPQDDAPGAFETIDVGGQFLTRGPEGISITGHWLHYSGDEGDETTSHQIGYIFLPWHRVLSITESGDLDYWGEHLEQWAKEHVRDADELRTAAQRHKGIHG